MTKRSTTVEIDSEIFEDGDAFKKLKSNLNKKIGELEPCAHADVLETDGTQVCQDCGMQVDVIVYDAEWRIYADSKGKDPSRCHRVKTNVKSIDKVVETLQLPESIKNATEIKYRTVVGDKTSRGTGRRSIVAACLLYAYRDMNDWRTQDEIRTMLNLTKKEMSAGLAKYYEKFPADRVAHAKPEHLIKRIMVLAEIDIEHYRAIVALTKYITGMSSLLNRSNTQSVAAAITYLYLCINPEYKKESGLSKTVFANKIKLSDITIVKLAKEALRVAIDGEDAEMDIKL